MLFDTHAHLNDPAFDPDREELMASFAEAGVGLVMNPGCSLESSRNAVQLANTYDYIYAAVGSHPDVADEVNEEVLEEYKKLCKLSPKVKAIGEIGLDYACGVDRDKQLLVFQAQLEIAQRAGKGVVIHCVRAFEKVMECLKNYSLKFVIFHGFIGSVQQAKRAIDVGHYLSFGPNAFRSPKTIAALLSTPENRLFAETDDSGEAIENVYSKIAQTRGISVEELKEIIENNYNKIFNIY